MPRTSFSLDGTTYAHLGGNELTFQIMPLHLLGKKSWNVYNQDNIEKVRRDEAAAKAKEEAEEERMQEIDAERRLQLLRGDIPIPPLAPPTLSEEEKRYNKGHEESGRGRKRRKLAGENDTDYEYRVANEDLQKSSNTKQVILRKSTSEAPLADNVGYINLFPQEHGRMNVAKNPEAEKETAKKKKEYEDQYTMRFSNAAGFKQGLEKPWYSKDSDSVEEVTTKDVWGNEDPRRKERQAARIMSNDPLAMMKQGASKVRQVERERKRWQEERAKEMESMVEAENTREKRKRRHHEEEHDMSPTAPGLGFEETDKSAREHRHRDKRRSHDRSDKRSHSYRHRSRSRDRRGEDVRKYKRHSQS